jgi:hypothetical protein
MPPMEGSLPMRYDLLGFLLAVVIIVVALLVLHNNGVI